MVSRLEIILALRGELFIPKGNQLLGIAWNGMFTMSLANTLWVIALSKVDTANIQSCLYNPFYFSYLDLNIS